MNKFYLLLVLNFLFCLTNSFAQKNKKETSIEIQAIKFGEIEINNKKYDHDIVIDNGVIRKRDKEPSKAFKNGGHTPLSMHEIIPWDCTTLVIGKGMSNRLPIWEEILEEAKKRGVEVIILRTTEAVKYINEHYAPGLNAILHITC